MLRRGRKEKLIQNFSRKHEGKSPLEIMEQGWEDSIHMTPARQRLDKDVPEVMLTTAERRLKAGIVKPE
jgi:hypothetical protein